jgi:hypothetical protein
MWRVCNVSMRRQRGQGCDAAMRSCVSESANAQLIADHLAGEDEGLSGRQLGNGDHDFNSRMQRHDQIK